MDLNSLEKLANDLKEAKELGEKQELLLQYPLVSQSLKNGELEDLLSLTQDLSSKIVLFSMVAIGEHQNVFSTKKKSQIRDKIKNLLIKLVAIDRFYESIGGIVGYQVQVLKFLHQSSGEKRATPAAFSRPEGIDLTTDSSSVQQAIWSGIQSLPEMGEVYAIGGLGARLNLKSKTGEALPAACLAFGGKTLLEGLIRDLQAREFLYYRLYNKQITVPVAIMSSLEKNNIHRVWAICEKERWFGRPRECFRIFSQLSVPVVTQAGHWSLKEPLEMNLQPGGHGALWKAADEEGVFFWLQTLEKKRLLIRQINNPIAGLDFGLLALAGFGKEENKTFGFASCERLPEAAEGVLVLVEEKGKRRISNIEYTDFKKSGIEEGLGDYPTNTNILYADLEKILTVIKKNPLPGLMLNMKTQEPFITPSGEKIEVLGGRLESMMQNMSDALEALKNEPLPTFVTYNARQKTISAIKKSFEKGKKLLETPEGAFYDLLKNAHALLKHCGMDLEPFTSSEEYLADGPSHLFLYHPALGPLYSVIAEKILGGKLTKGSELQLEIADVLLDNVQIEGSLVIQAKHVMGHDSHGITRYSQRTGKCVLRNVQVINKGINRKQTTDFWKNSLKRKESLKIILQGHSEFYAEGVAFVGKRKIVVPPGERWTALQDGDGKIRYQVEKANWRWGYQDENGKIKCFRD